MGFTLEEIQISDIKSGVLTTQILNWFRSKAEFENDRISSTERKVLLKTIDSEWICQMNKLLSLKEDIGFRSFGNPESSLDIFKEEAVLMYEKMMENIYINSIKMINSLIVFR